MSAKSSTNQRSTTTPIFAEGGSALLSSLTNLFNRDPESTSAGQFFLDTLQGRNANADRLEEQIGLITQASDAALPQDLAKARSFSRGRPDTFGMQTAMNTVADNRIGRDLSIAGLLREQGNQDMLSRLGAASSLASLDTNRFGQGTALLSLLRGESSTGTARGSSFDPFAALSSVGGFIGNTKPSK